MTASRWAPYGAALALGALFVACLFPWASVFPADYTAVAWWGDRAAGMIGQRYFLAAPWGWPPLQSEALDGVNTALTDSIPLAMLLLKPFRAWLPPGFYLQEGWIALVWLLQPVAAVYALRGAGVRSWAGTLAVAALSMLPTLMARFGHTALDTHALILLALGLYLRLIRGGRGWWACVPLLLVSLLVHPYLMAMVAAVLLAGPLSLLLAGRRWGPSAAWLGLGLAGTGMAALLLGFGGTAEAPLGYGIFSMNLLAPFAPSRSTLFPNMAFDATGGQVGEGYQYLGGGLLMLLAVAGVLAVLGRGGFRWRRHAGLLLVMAGLVLFAASGTAYLGPYRLLNITRIPHFVQQFRVTGRFFWPVAYALLVWAVAVVVRGLPGRAAALVLLAAVGLQAADMPTHWKNVQAWLYPQTWAINAAALAPIIAAHDRVTLWPTFQCGVDGGDTRFMQVLLLASNTAPRVNTMYVARSTPVLACDAAAVLGQPWRPHELRIILPPAAADTRLLVPDGDRLCRRLDSLFLCSRDDPALLALQP